MKYHSSHFALGKQKIREAKQFSQGMSYLGFKLRFIWIRVWWVFRCTRLLLKQIIIGESTSVFVLQKFFISQVLVNGTWREWGHSWEATRTGELLRPWIWHVGRWGQQRDPGHSGVMSEWGHWFPGVGSMGTTRKGGTDIVFFTLKYCFTMIILVSIWANIKKDSGLLSSTKNSPDKFHKNIYFSCFIYICFFGMYQYLTGTW